MIAAMYMLLATILLALAYIVIGGVRRPRRLWFVGECDSPIARLRDERLLVLREVKDLEAGHEAGKIQNQEFTTLHERAMNRVRELTAQFDQCEAAVRAGRRRVEQELQDRREARMRHAPDEKKL